MRHGWLAFSLLLAACVGAAVRPVVFPAANAAAPTEVCDWRFLNDGGLKNIPGADGKGVMDAEWTQMSRNGYRLAAVHDTLHFFERCTPTP